MDLHLPTLATTVATTVAQDPITTFLSDPVIGIVPTRLVDSRTLRRATLVSAAIHLIQTNKHPTNSSRCLNSNSHNTVNIRPISQVMDTHQNQIAINQVIIWVIRKETAV